MHQPITPSLARVEEGKTAQDSSDPVQNRKEGSEFRPPVHDCIDCRGGGQTLSLCLKKAVVDSSERALWDQTSQATYSYSTIGNLGCLGE